MDSLQREAEEYKKQVAHERELRLKKQQEREALLQEIEIFNSEFFEYQQKMKQYFNERREMHEFLTNKVNYWSFL